MKGEVGGSKTTERGSGRGDNTVVAETRINKGRKK